MIHINLLKNSAEKRSIKTLSMGKVFIAAGAVVITGVCIFGGMYGYRWFKAHQKIVRVASVTPMAQKGLAPSTYSASSAANMVEEVVKEVNDSRLKFRESGVLDLPYDQLSFAERINYELLFPKNVCEMLSRVIPAGIGLKSLEIDNFQTVYAVGLGPARASIQNMLLSLKKEKVNVLAPPYSFVKPAGKEGLRFAFSCKTNFGLNLTDPIVDGSLSRLPSRGALPEVCDRFGILAKQNHITITKKIKQTSAEKVGNYYRVLYQWSGTASYKDFTQFVLGLYESKLMVALKRCALTAKTSSLIAIESQFVVTAKE
jgi:hypothetical protein